MIEQAVPVEKNEEESLLHKFSAEIKDVEERTRFIKAATAKTTSWSLRHKGTYYRGSFALQMKQVFDEMIQNRKPRVFRYINNGGKHGLSNRTLYMKIVQSKCYLLDHMDDDGKYKQMCQCIDITPKQKVGVIISFRDDMASELLERPDEFSPDYVEHQKDNDWHAQMEAYLQDEHSTGKPFEVKGLVLDEEEQTRLEIYLSQLTNITYRITADKVLIVKLPS